MSRITADEARVMVKEATERLIREEQELNIKIIALVDFNNEYLESMSLEERKLFKRQEKAMIDYSLALRERIES